MKHHSLSWFIRLHLPDCFWSPALPRFVGPFRSITCAIRLIRWGVVLELNVVIPWPAAPAVTKIIAKQFSSSICIRCILRLFLELCRRPIPLRAREGRHFNTKWKSVNSSRLHLLWQLIQLFLVTTTLVWEMFCSFWFSYVLYEKCSVHRFAAPFCTDDILNISHLSCRWRSWARNRRPWCWEARSYNFPRETIDWHFFCFLLWGFSAWSLALASLINWTQANCDSSGMLSCPLFFEPPSFSSVCSSSSHSTLCTMQSASHLLRVEIVVNKS